MLAYIVRRLLYAIPILIGVNLLTFALFFVVNTPDDMARMQLGMKRVTPEAIQSCEQAGARGFLSAVFRNVVDSGARRQASPCWVMVRRSLMSAMLLRFRRCSMQSSLSWSLMPRPIRQ